MTQLAQIEKTRTFTSDETGAPVSRQRALAEQTAEERQLAYLAATGVPAVDLTPPATLADAYLEATGAIEAETPAAETAESTDPVGDAWLLATGSGFTA